MATNSSSNVGIRRECGTLGMRNFENSGTVQYKSNSQVKDKGLYIAGSLYTAGTTITFDVGGTSYSKTALELLELYWNQGLILPLT